MGTRPWSRITLEGLVLINIMLNRVNYSGRLSNNFSSINQAYAWLNNAQNCIFLLSIFQKLSAAVGSPPTPLLVFFTVRKSS